MTANLMVPIEKIIPDSNQPRKYFDVSRMATLRASISEMGIRNPLIVEKQGSNYLIIDGERRFRTAKDLKMKQVPVIVIESKDPIGRLIEQFHIQEQHEGWNPAEKASVLIKLSEEINKPISHVAEMLGITQRTASTYMALGRLTYKDIFTKLNVPLSMASAIDSLKRTIKRTYADTQKESLPKSTLDKIEKEILQRIESKEIETPRDIVRIKDTMMKDFKYIDVFTKGDLSVDEMYVKSKAKIESIVRGLAVSSAYLSNGIARLLEDRSVKLTKEQISAIKGLYSRLKELANLVDLD